MENISGGAFRLGPKQSPFGALLIHGFTGTPFEVRLLGEGLAQAGMAVRGPALRGHATCAYPEPGRWPSAISAQSFMPWIEDVEAALDALGQECDQVAVCGLSMGGLLAIELACKRPERVTRLVLLACALEFPSWLAATAAWIRGVPTLARLPIPKFAGSDIADARMKAENERMQRGMRMPIAGLLSLFALAADARPKLSQVSQPTLVMHGRHDHTIPLSAFHRAIAGIEAGQGQGSVATQILENSFHLLPIDIDRQLVFDAVLHHVQK